MSNCAEFLIIGSRRFVAGCTLLHGLAAVLIVVGPFSTWSLMLLPMLAMNLWRTWRLNQQGALLRHSEGGWWLVDDADHAVPLRWLPATRIGPSLTLLHARSERGRHFWPVASDSLPADEFRRLRVLVR